MTQTSSTPPPRRRWLRGLLFVSLALNLAVLGIVGGAFLNINRQGEERPSRISRELGLGPYLFAMDRGGRDALRQAAGTRNKDIRQSRSDWKRAFSESLDVLRADPFDPGRFRELVEKQADLATAGRKVGQDVLVEQVSAMSAHERRDLADRLEKGIGSGFGQVRPHRDGPKMGQGDQNR